MKECRPSRPCSTDSSRKLASPCRAQAEVRPERREQIGGDVHRHHSPKNRLRAMPLPALLDELLRAHGPSGHEHLAFDVVRTAVEAVAEVETTRSATSSREAGARRRPAARPLRAPRRDRARRRAHRGRRAALGAPARQLAGRRRLRPAGRDQDRGTASCPASSRRRSKDDEKKSTGATSTSTSAPATARRPAGSSLPGDPIVVAAPPLELAHRPRRLAQPRQPRGRLRRAGGAAAARGGAGPIAADVAVVAGAQEELGESGRGQRSPRALRADVAIVLDVTYATDVPGDDPTRGRRPPARRRPGALPRPAVNPACLRARSSRRPTRRGSPTPSRRG